MSENAATGIEYLQRRLAQVESEKADLQRALKDERRGNRAIRDALGAKSIGEAVKLVSELVEATDGWDDTLKELETLRTQAKASSPDAKDARIQELEGQLGAGKHRDAFAGLALAPGATIEDVWGKLGYKPEGDAPTAEKVADLVQQARAKAPFLFAGDDGGSSSADSQTRSATPPVEAPPGSGGSRGARDTSSARLKYTLDDVGEPGWEQKRPELVKAIAAGTATLVDAK